MSQAYKIYDYLIRTKNQAADKALLIALRHSAEPYQSVILDGILDRGRPAATFELVHAYHEFSPEWQKLLLERVDTLYGGLRLAAQAPQEQTRMNCLEIIRRSAYRKIADVVVILLRDPVPPVAQQAADTLLGLAQSLARPETQSPQAESRIFHSALENAVHNYHVHHRSEALIAAMVAVPADDSSFWQDGLKPYYEVGKTIRYILLNYDRPEIARFCVSALKHPDLYTTAVRAISHHQNPDYLAAVAAEAKSQAHEQVTRGLKLIKKPRWLHAGCLSPDYFEKNSMSDLISLVAAIGAPNEQKADCFYGLIMNAEEKVALQAVKAMASVSGSAALDFFRKTAQAPCESVVLVSLVQVIRKKHPNIRAIIGEHLNSPYPRVQKLARRYYQYIAFECYWKKFDDLSYARRLQAGRAVYKIDSKARSRWEKYAFDKSPLLRLKAIRMARLLGHLSQCDSEMIRLARDEDRIVRSCAVAALGEMDKAGEPGLKNCLFDSLKDSDFRVQANAIEALEHRPDHQVVESISSCTQSPNNRVRANAIKALLTWKMKSARQAIQQMLRDPRAAHRLSAQWVLENTDVDFSPAPSRKEAVDAVAV